MQTPMHWKHNVIQITIARMFTINYITMIMDTSVTILTALRLTCAGMHIQLLLQQLNLNYDTFIPTFEVAAKV